MHACSSGVGRYRLLEQPWKLLPEQGTNSGIEINWTVQREERKERESPQKCSCRHYDANFRSYGILFHIGTMAAAGVL